MFYLKSSPIQDVVYLDLRLENFWSLTSSCTFQEILLLMTTWILVSCFGQQLLKGEGVCQSLVRKTALMSVIILVGWNNLIVFVQQISNTCCILGIVQDVRDDTSIQCFQALFCVEETWYRQRITGMGAVLDLW